MKSRRLMGRVPWCEDYTLPDQAVLCSTTKPAAQCRSWVIRAGLRLGRSPIHVRSTPNSDRKFKAHLLVAMCHNQS
jgi:hypothetical protein